MDSDVTNDIRPRCGTLAHYFGRLIIFLCGWRVEGEVPMARSMLVIAAPHTSNLDGFLLVGAAYTLHMRINWLVKSTLFYPVVGQILKFLGGVPVERSRSNNLVSRLAQQIKDSDGTALVVPPSGTRGYTDYWKSGFYRIALEADIPVVCGYLDYSRKVAGLGPTIRLTGNITEDMDKLRAFYTNITARYPDQKSRIRLREEDEIEAPTNDASSVENRSRSQAAPALKAPAGAIQPRPVPPNDPSPRCP